MMMNLLRKITLFITVTGLITMMSCLKDNFDFDRLSDEIELETSLVAPIIYGTVNLEDVVELVDSLGYTRIDSTGYIYIVYSDTAFAVRADTVIDLPDKIYTEYYIDSEISGNPQWIGSGVGDTIYFEKIEKIGYGLEGEDRLDSIYLKAGTFQIDVLSQFRHTGFLTISSDHILDGNGNPFSTVIMISDLSGNFTDQQLFDMEGYFASTEYDVIGDSTYIEITFELALINSGNSINPGEQCQIDLNFFDIDFYSVFGFIEKRELLNESGSVQIPSYENNPELANIIFANPQINLYIDNSMGIPMEIELSNVYGISSIDGSTVDLIFNDIFPFDIAAPGVDQIGESVHSELNINNQTSNIDDLLNSAPSELFYDFIGSTDNINPDEEHFVLDTSELQVELELLLPMNLRTSGYYLSDTLEFSFGVDGVDTTLVKFAKITLETNNGLPIELQIQIYFTDEAYNVLDSMFVGTVPLLEAAPVDANGVVISKILAVNSADFDSDKLAKLQSVSYVVFEARLVSTNEGAEFVKIYTHYDLDFELSILGNFNISNRQ